MVVGMEARVEGGSELVRDMNKILTQVPEFEREQSKKIARFFQNSIQRTVRSKLMWRGDLLNSVDIVPNPEGFGDYKVEINAPIEGRKGDYAAWHENANSGHHVTIRDENRPIDQWAREHGIKQGTTIFVRPQPFMDSSVRQAAKRLRQHVNKGADVEKFINRYIG